jgi:hypothetical protein
MKTMTKLESTASKTYPKERISRDRESSSSRIYIILSLPCGRETQEDSPGFRGWETIVDNLSRGGWNWGCVSTANSDGRTIFVADAHHGNGKRSVMHADEKLTAFVELESATRGLPPSHL